MQEPITQVQDHEGRIGRLEGIAEQLDRRLESMDRRLDTLTRLVLGALIASLIAACGTLLNLLSK